ncbi:hypothetical protein [Embleya sp. NPDC059237]|uniref:hypothetical protein n=1 Tax=Embleya sp. NPDC059237 TaxID=3346784 RepID=UPI0036AE6FED
MSESTEWRDPEAFDPTDAAEMVDLGLTAIEVLDAFDVFEPERLLDAFNLADPERPFDHTEARDMDDGYGIDPTRALPDDFSIFLHRHMLCLTQFAFRYVDTREEAEQAVSRVMVEVSQRWHELAESAKQFVFRRLLEILEDRAGGRARARRAIAPHRPEHGRPNVPARPWADAFVGFSRAHRPALVRYASRHPGVVDRNSEDVVTEVLLAMYMRWDLIAEHRSPPQVLAYRILQRMADSRQRGRRGSVDGVAVDSTGPRRPSDSIQGDPCRSGSERDLLTRAFDLLPPERGACAWFGLVMRVPPADIAAYLGVTISTVRSHLHFARRELTAILEGTVPLDPVRPRPPQGENI